MRRRINAFRLRRAPDGSAFKRCELCGLSYPIALSDMHDCEPKSREQKRRCHRLNFSDQPRSAFRFFMEWYKKRCKTHKLIEIDRSGFQKWKRMSAEQRKPFIYQAEEVHLAYDKILMNETKESEEEDDEADSAEVGKIDMVAEAKLHPVCSENFDSESYGSWFPPWSCNSSWYEPWIC